MLSKRGLERLGIRYKGYVINSLSGAILRYEDEEVRIKSDEIKAYVLDRKGMAKSLYDEAKAAGAEISLGRRLSVKEILQLEREHEIIVGADGAVSNVSRVFGFKQINEYVYTYKAEYGNAHVDDKHTVELFFSNRISHRFFGWMAPYSGTEVEV
ncbi:geranylgeranyl reductase, partial [mine drainage metagenome]